MNHCAQRIGDAYFRTPRNTIKGFLDLLAVLEQNPDRNWEDLVTSVNLERESNPDLAPLGSATEQSPEPARTPEFLTDLRPADDRHSTNDTDDELSAFRL